MQAGIVALGLLDFSPQPPRLGAASRFPVSVIRVLAVEGGYVEHRVDPGGPTKHGVTRARLAQHRGRPVTKAEVRRLTAAEAVAIYRTLYWDALAADALPAGLDHALFDFAVHSGVPRAARPCSARSA
jgi:lysozyme family protein